MGHENGSQVGIDHVVDFSTHQSTLLQHFQNSSLCCAMHVRPGNPRTHRLNHSDLCRKHSIVYQQLVFGKFAIDRETAGYVTGITMVFGSHVQKRHVAIEQLPIVWSSRMAVVQDGGIRTTRAYARVGHQAASSVGVRIVLKQGFQLVFHHSNFTRSHHFDVGHAGYPVGVSHQFDLGLCLEYPRFRNRRKECFRVAFLRVFCDPVVVRRHGVVSGIAVETRKKKQLGVDIATIFCWC
mmetsp:Transcript_11485/g.26630  ORF Transcript_11485/g.26630 Transcript_11485/m.26630 type:complete len:238 (-) Transcript_11485:538-1251(-)